MCKRYPAKRTMRSETDFYLPRLRYYGLENYATHGPPGEGQSAAHEYVRLTGGRPRAASLFVGSFLSSARSTSSALGTLSLDQAANFSALTIGHVIVAIATSAGRCVRGRYTGIAAPRGSHFRIGKALSNVTLTNSALPRCSRVLRFRGETQAPTGASRDVWQGLFPMFSRLGRHGPRSSEWNDSAPRRFFRDSFSERPRQLVCLSGLLQGHSSGNFGLIRKIIS